MLQEGQLVLFRFPQTDRQAGKLRPALVLRQLPGRYDDWLICMVSSQLQQTRNDIDEVLEQTSPDFLATGLKRSSVIRTTRLAVVHASILEGAIGNLTEERLLRIRRRLASWIAGDMRG